VLIDERRRSELMPRSFAARTSTLLAAALGLGVASAHLSPRSSTIIEFEPGSAVFAATAAEDLEDARLPAIQHPREYRVVVRGYADTGSNPDPRTWKAEDLALAEARARALSAAVRQNGGPACVDRIAYGHALKDWRGTRIDGKSWGLAGGVVAIAPLASKETPEAGVPINRDCGEPAPSAT
jgi:hypothetical protein